MDSARQPGSIRSIAVLALLLLFWGLALHYGQWLIREYGGVSVRIHGDAPNAAALKKAMDANEDENILRLTGWSRSEREVELSNSALGRSAKARRVSVWGDLSDVVPMKLLYGGFPAPEDENGCVLDEKSALALFGSADVAGAQITLEAWPVAGGAAQEGEALSREKLYTVRGVAEAREPSLFVRDRNASYENLEFACGELSRAKDTAEAFIFRNALGTQYTFVDNGFYAKLLSMFLCMPGWIIGAAALLPLMREAFRRRFIPLQLAVYSAAAIGAFFALRWLLDAQIDWPGRFLPSRWSDFEFWAELWKAETASFEKAALLLPLPKDMLWNEAMLKLLACLAAACFFAARFTRCPIKPNAAFIAIPSCTALAALALFALGMEFMLPRGYFIAPAALWAMRYVGGRLISDRIRSHSNYNDSLKRIA